MSFHKRQHVQFVLNRIKLFPAVILARSLRMNSNSDFFPLFKASFTVAVFVSLRPHSDILGFFVISHLMMWYLRAS
jgi:hypothetical protein